MLEQFFPDETATEAFGGQLALTCPLGSVIYLKGELGAGKTTLVRGFLRALQHQGAVRSPTYALVEDYVTAAGTVYHFDLYRLADPEELELIGVRDYFDQKAWCLVEWPERGYGVLPAPDLIVEIAYHLSGREVCLAGGTARGEGCVQAIQATIT